MTFVQSYVVAAETATLVFGGAVTLGAARAYRRTGSASLRALALGLGLVTVGGLAGGMAHQFLDLPLDWASAIQATFSAFGFAVLAYALYARTGSDRETIADRQGGLQSEDGGSTD